MKENGKMISNMDLVLKFGPIMRNLKVNMKMVKKNGLVSYILPMDLSTKEILPATMFMDMEHIHGLIIEFILVNGVRIKCMVREKLSGQMVNHMKESI